MGWDVLMLQRSDRAKHLPTSALSPWESTGAVTSGTARSCSDTTDLQLPTLTAALRAARTLEQCRGRGWEEYFLEVGRSDSSGKSVVLLHADFAPLALKGVRHFRACFVVEFDFH